MTTAPQTMPNMPTALRIEINPFPLELLDDGLLQPEARLALGNVLRQRLLDLWGRLEVEVLRSAGGTQASAVDCVGDLPLTCLARGFAAIDLGRELGPRRSHVE